MAHTYNTTPFDDIARVRLIIGDHPTPITGAHFTDEELQEFITQAGGNLTQAAISALEAWMGALTREFKSEKIGDYAYTRETIANMQKLKDQLILKDASTPVFEWSEPDLSGVEDTTVSEDIE